MADIQDILHFVSPLLEVLCDQTDQELFFEQRCLLFEFCHEPFLVEKADHNSLDPAIFLFGDLEEVSKTQLHDYESGVLELEVFGCLDVFEGDLVF